MKKIFYKYFIPHADNNYHPHILHAKRAWFYGALGLFIKCLVIFAVLMLPAEAYVMPDILAVEESKVVMLTNNYRAGAGIAKLKENAKLNASASYKAEDMAGKKYFAHESPEGNRLPYFLDKAGYAYRSAGENLAIGYFDAVEVVAAWKASPTHKANMLDKDFTEIGVSSKSGIYEGVPNLYIAEHFGSPEASQQISVKKDTAKKTALTSSKNVLAEKTYTNAPSASSSDVAALSVEKKSVELTAVANAKNNNIAWFDKYKTANNVLSDTMPFFGFSKLVYLCLIMFFAVALTINVLVEMKIQHKHVIVRTLGLLGALVGLWLI